MAYIIKKSPFPHWGYESFGPGFHGLAPTVEAAISGLKVRFGDDVAYTLAPGTEDAPAPVPIPPATTPAPRPVPAPPADDTMQQFSLF